MSWDDYYKDLMESGELQDAVICAFNPFSVLAADAEGILGKITEDEIDELAARNCFHLKKELTLAGLRCRILRVNFNGDFFIMNVRTTARKKSLNITISKTYTTYIIVMGREGVHGEKVNAKTHTMSDFLQHLNL